MTEDNEQIPLLQQDNKILKEKLDEHIEMEKDLNEREKVMKQKYDQMEKDKKYVKQQNDKIRNQINLLGEDQNKLKEDRDAFNNDKKILRETAQLMVKRLTIQSKILKIVPMLVNGPDYYSQQEWTNIQDKASYFQQTLESTEFLLTNLQPILKQLASRIEPYYCTY